MEKIKKAALDVLLHNLHGPCDGLPRTAGWGYPEPYTRDWMIAALGVLASGDEELLAALRAVLVALAKHQTSLGHIPSLAHDPTDCGASDTTPLFLIALALFRSTTGEVNFLEEPARKALKWLRYQSPYDNGMITQQPTSDWRDEQWVWGYGLYVNTLVYACFRLYGLEERAQTLSALINRPSRSEVKDGQRIHEGLALAHQPYYALWTYKIHASERFDLLGNSLAILFGVASPSKAQGILQWVETSCEALHAHGDLALPLPPCLIPYIQPQDPDWLPRYQEFNRPGNYHNGGIWPFIVGFYIAALTAAGQHRLAAEKFEAFSRLVMRPRSPALASGFNEWFNAQDGQPCGQDWQTWSAAMYLYATACVEHKSTPFFSREDLPVKK